MIWLWNHTSYTKVYFNEFVANAFVILVHANFWPPRLWGLLEAKNIISQCKLCHFNSTFGHPVVSVLLTKDSPRNDISYDSQPQCLELYNQARRAWFLLWYHSEALEVLYSPNQFLGLDFFAIYYSTSALGWLGIFLTLLTAREL